MKLTSLPSQPLDRVGRRGGLLRAIVDHAAGGESVDQEARARPDRSQMQLSKSRPKATDI
jgi:hypothetical protein